LFKASLDWLEAHVALIEGGLRGVEKETLRIAPDGQLSQRKHPRALGSALEHPYLTTDYSEALLEFVTPPLASNWETLQFLCDMHIFVHRNIGNEMLWPASMPCVLNPESEIPIADYGPSNAGMMRTIYRRGLGHRYGRAMQAIAGAHFNYSPPVEFWPADQERRGSRSSLKEFRSARFMDLVRNYRRHAWIVIYLFGASPAFCKSFRPQGHDMLSELDPSTWYAQYATSLRMSDMGYRNKTQARLNISANSLAEYVAGLDTAIRTVEPDYEAIGVIVDGEYRQLNAHILQIENEYYSSIRPKPARRDVRPTAALAQDGVEYVEIRSLDLNAADPVGLNQPQLRLLETLALYCLMEDSPPIDAAEQTEIDARELMVARRGRTPGLSFSVNGDARPLREHGLQLLDRLAELAVLLDRTDAGYVAAVEAAREALQQPERTPSARLLKDLEASGTSFFEYGLELARQHQEYFLALPLELEKRQALEAQAADSLAVAAAREAAPAPSFDEYLEAYFATDR